MKPSRIVGVLALAGVSACTVGPDFVRPAPPSAPDYGAASQPGKPFGSAKSGDTAQRLVADMDISAEWWTLFQSEKLSRLVDDALKNNPNVTAAQAALRQAHELYSAQRAAFFPTIQGNLGATRAENASGAIAPLTTTNNPYYSLYTAQLTLSYVPDVFGANARAVEAAQAQVDMNRYQLEAAYLTLSSNVVVTAVGEAALRGQIAATERLIELQHQLTVTVQQQRALGTASNFDVLAQQSAEAQTAATLPPLQKQLGQSRDALTVLLGRLPSDEPPETFNLDELTLPSELPASLPAKLVDQRPDIRQAEETLHAASAEVGVAESDRLPQFAITGNIGSSALELGNVFTPGNQFWALGTSLTQTLFDAGALLHKQRAADAALDEAGAQYRAAVIVACQNVADTLRALRADADGQKATDDADRAAKATFDLAQRQYQLGTVALVAVLNAEQAYRQAELALVQARANRYSDTAGLFQALGGGWWNRPREAANE